MTEIPRQNNLQITITYTCAQEELTTEQRELLNRTLAMVTQTFAEISPDTGSTVVTIDATVRPTRIRRQLPLF